MAKVQLITKNNIRIYVSDMTDIANFAVQKHEAKPLGALILATSIAVFGPLATMKRNTKTSAILNGDGSIGTVIVESTEQGYVRASIANPKVVTEYDQTRPNDLPLGLGIGLVGTLKILQTVDKITFGGEVKLAKGDVVTDMAYYFEASEQTKSAVLSSVLLGEGTHVKRAYGVIMQMLPGYTQEDIQWVEKFIEKNKLKEHSIEKFIKAIDGIVLEQKELIWKCSCSQAKFKEILGTITKTEQEKLIQEHGQIEIKCNFCNKKSIFK